MDKKEKDDILRTLANASMKTLHPAKPLFINYTAFEKMDKTLKKEIRDNGIIILEKGLPWEKLKQGLQRYKSITIKVAII